MTGNARYCDGEVMASKRLTGETAARIAQEHGLGAPDAVALLHLANTEQEASRIAATFKADKDADSIAERAMNGGLG